MNSQVLSALTSTMLSPLSATGVLLENTAGKSKFDNTSSTIIAVIVILVVVGLVLWVMSLMATYRLTGSTLQVILCLLFGSFYLFFAWIAYGFTGHKLVKMSKA